MHSVSPHLKSRALAIKEVWDTLLNWIASKYEGITSRIWYEKSNNEKSLIRLIPMYNLLSPKTFLEGFVSLFLTPLIEFWIYLEYIAILVAPITLYVTIFSNTLVREWHTYLFINFINFSTRYQTSLNSTLLTVNY